MNDITIKQISDSLSIKKEQVEALEHEFAMASDYKRVFITFYSTIVISSIKWPQPPSLSMMKST